MAATAAATVVAHFLRANEQERLALRRSFPSLLTAEVVAAVDEASQILAEAEAHAAEAFALVDDVDRDLNLTPAGTVCSSMPSGGRETFEHTLAQLILRSSADGGDVDDDSDLMDVSNLRIEEKLSTVLSTVAEFAGFRALTCLEATCKLLREALGRGAHAPAIWFGVAMREFPEQVKPLLMRDDDIDMVRRAEWRAQVRRWGSS